MLLPVRCGSPGPGSPHLRCPGARGAEGHGVLRWRGDVPARARMRGEPLERAAGARQSQACGRCHVWAALGTATRCHPWQWQCYPGTRQLHTSCLRGEVSSCPQAEHPFPSLLIAAWSWDTPSPGCPASQARLGPRSPGGLVAQWGHQLVPTSSIVAELPFPPRAEVCTGLIPPPNLSAPLAVPHVPWCSASTTGCLCHCCP